MKKPIIILTILIFMIITLFGVRAYVSNRLSTSGVELGYVKDEINKYKTENIILSEKVNSLSSLSNISSAAVKLGFSESKSNYALTKAKPIALKQ